MCCHDDAALDLPPAVIEMVARYRRLRAEQGVGWGEEAFPDMFRWARFARLGPAFAAFSASGDWAGAVRAAVGTDVPAGLALVTVAADGGLTVRTGPARPVVPGTTVQIDVVLDSKADRGLVVAVDGAEVPVPAHGAGLRTVDAAEPIVVTCGAAGCTIDAVVPSAAATLRLTSTTGSVRAALTLVRHRRDRWRLVRRGCPGQVGLRRPSVLPHRPRPDRPHRSGRSAARRRRPRDRVRAPRGRRHAGGGGDRDRRVRPAAPVRPGRRRLVRRRPARPPQLQRRPRAGTGRCRADAARRGPRADAPHRRQPGGRPRLRRGAAGGDGGHGPAGGRRARPRGPGVPQPDARACARPRPDRRPGAAVHRRGRHRPPLGLAPQQRGVRADARPRRGDHLRAPGLRAGRRRRR